ncbi:phage holin family protein [Phormidium sp. CCY1219]|uniref:phage holin family protein n=1 Tax=Phormidium sp. CCY1219 TaxID=2886104 RepID=UPI002D1F5289|nr:phage holin family protein [Phormidium sp. CCY1219]MEB3830162.1 phage holin family protein [Phormidium sp. CCY1219]
MNIVQIVITWLVTAVSLFLISKIPIGVEIDGFPKALVSAAVFGLLNAFLLPLLKGITLFKLTNTITLGLWAVLLNTIIFGLAAWLVSGFRLRLGILSAVLGAIALGIVNSILFHLLASLNL